MLSPQPSAHTGSGVLFSTGWELWGWDRTFPLPDSTHSGNSPAVPLMLEEESDKLPWIPVAILNYLSRCGKGSHPST